MNWNRQNRSWQPAPLRRIRSERPKKRFSGSAGRMRSRRYSKGTWMPSGLRRAQEKIFQNRRQRFLLLSRQAKRWRERQRRQKNGSAWKSGTLPRYPRECRSLWKFSVRSGRRKNKLPSHRKNAAAQSRKRKTRRKKCRRLRKTNVCGAVRRKPFPRQRSTMSAGRQNVQKLRKSGRISQRRKLPQRRCRRREIQRIRRSRLLSKQAVYMRPEIRNMRQGGGSFSMSRPD